MPIEDLTGQTFNRLTVIELSEIKRVDNKRRRVLWICKCTCGKITRAESTNLKNGHSHKKSYQI